MLNRTKRLLICASAIALHTACGRDLRQASTPEEAVQVTNQFWAEELPQVNLANLRIKTRDLGDKWLVTYEPPEGSLGAEWIFEVDKASARIVNVSGGQ
jgi:hypothetical protein